MATSGVKPFFLRILNRQALCQIKPGRHLLKEWTETTKIVVASALVAIVTTKSADLAERQLENFYARSWF
jgi:hypothetical protein